MIMGGIDKYLMHLLDLFQGAFEMNLHHPFFLDEQHISPPKKIGNKKKDGTLQKRLLMLFCFVLFFPSKFGGFHPLLISGAVLVS